MITTKAYEAACNGCDWKESHGPVLVHGKPIRSGQTEGQRAATWHVYTEHPEIWKRVIGSERKPHDKRPRTGKYRDTRYVS